MLQSALAMFNLSRREWALLLAITTLALALRLYELESIPPGLHHDEALNGLEAHELWVTGARPIYLGSGFNGEPLLEYSIMASEALFGLTPFAVRLPSALYGALTIPIVFFLAREILEIGYGIPRASSISYPISNSASFIAPLILSYLYWHLNASREGYKPIFLPLFGALTFLFLLKAFRADHPPHFPFHGLRSTLRAPRSTLYTLLAGVTLGFSAYTYPSIRFLYPAVMLFVVFLMVRDRAHWRVYLMRATLIACIALLIFAPLGFHYLRHPDDFFRRAEQTAVRNAAEALNNLPKVAGLFFVQGDDNPRHNIPARPALDWILALGFIVGVARALWQWRQPTHFLLLTWLLAMLIPSVVTEAAPNFLRTLGAAAPTVLLVTLGFATILDFRQRSDALALQTAKRDLRVPSLATRLASRAARLFLLSSPKLPYLLYCLLALSALSSFYHYFIIMPTEPRAWTGFDVGLLKIGEYVRDAPADELLYLTPFTTEQATIQFVLGEAHPNFKWFDGRKCFVAPPPNRSATLLIVAEDFRTLTRAQAAWPQGQITRVVRDFAGHDYLTVFKLPAQPPTLAPRIVVNRLFGDHIELLGYSIVFGDVVFKRIEAGQGVPLQLFWRATRPIPKDYTVFTQLLGPPNPRKNGAPLWGQRDKQPCETFYPTTRWSVGETIVEDFNLVSDKDAPAGQYAIALGLYDLATGARLRLPNGADHLSIGPIEIFR
jgi:4-amino-4-deoxy-L-arabinose transferase-like glycosyltransferase